MFFLIYHLRDKYSIEELTDLMINWYHYNGGHKMTKYNIKRKVIYHQNTEYTFRPHYLETLLGETE